MRSLVEVQRIVPDLEGEFGINIDEAMTHEELVELLRAIPTGAGWPAINRALNPPAT